MHVVHSRKKNVKCLSLPILYIHKLDLLLKTHGHTYIQVRPHRPLPFLVFSLSLTISFSFQLLLFCRALFCRIFFLFYFAIRLILFGVVALQFLFFRWTVWHNLDVSFHIIFNFFPYSPAAPSIGSSIHFCYLLYFCWCCLSVHCFGLLCSTRLCSMLHAPCFSSCELANGANLRFNGTSTEINCNNT